MIAKIKTIIDRFNAVAVVTVGEKGKEETKEFSCQVPFNLAFKVDDEVKLVKIAETPRLEGDKKVYTRTAVATMPDKK